MIPLVDKAALLVVAVLPRSATVIIQLVDKTALLVVAVLPSLSDRYHTIGGQSSVTCCGCVTIAQRPL